MRLLRRSEWGQCSRFHMGLESILHNGGGGDENAGVVGAADDFEQAAGGEFFH